LPPPQQQQLFILVHQHLHEVASPTSTKKHERNNPIYTVVFPKKVTPNVKTMFRFSILLISSILVLLEQRLSIQLADAFFVGTPARLLHPPYSTSISKKTVQYAGGFEWEDPTESFDQGVENPFKNPELMKGEEGLKIDPARLLGPRLNGVNLYLIGMMGTGKSSVGDKVARRK
jgi:hypothetical protein